MKRAIFLTTMIFVSMSASAGTNEKIEFQPEMLVEVLDGVKYLAKTCETMMSSALLVNEIEYKQANNTKEKAAASMRATGGFNPFASNARITAARVPDPGSRRMNCSSSRRLSGMFGTPTNGCSRPAITTSGFGCLKTGLSREMMCLNVMRTF